MINQPSNDSLSIVVGMLSERSGLWQVTAMRMALLHQYAQKLSSRSNLVLQDMISSAQGERFWTMTSERYIALNEVRAKAGSVDKDDITRLIADVVMCSKRDGVAHREWVRNVLDVLAKLSSER